MAVSANDIRDHFSEFSGLSDTVINQWMAQAERRVNRTQWGEKADDAVLWLTAHLLAFTQPMACGKSPASGPMASKKVGDLAVTFKIKDADRASDSFLASTPYGQYYLTLRTGVWPTRVLGDCCAT